MRCSSDTDDLYWDTCARRILSEATVYPDDRVLARIGRAVDDLTHTVSGLNEDR